MIPIALRPLQEYSNSYQFSCRTRTPIVSFGLHCEVPNSIETTHIYSFTPSTKLDINGNDHLYQHDPTSTMIFNHVSSSSGLSQSRWSFRRKKDEQLANYVAYIRPILQSNPFLLQDWKHIKKLTVYEMWKDLFSFIKRRISKKYRKMTWKQLSNTHWDFGRNIQDFSLMLYECLKRQPASKKSLRRSFFCKPKLIDASKVEPNCFSYEGVSENIDFVLLNNSVTEHDYCLSSDKVIPDTLQVLDQHPINEELCLNTSASRIGSPSELEENIEVELCDLYLELESLSLKSCEVTAPSPETVVNINDEILRFHVINLLPEHHSSLTHHQVPPTPVNVPSKRPMFLAGHICSKKFKAE